MRKITKEEMSALITLYNGDVPIPKERFWCKDGDRYVEMDNTDGCCYVSDSETKEECFMRCIGYLDLDGIPYNTRELYRDFMKLVNHIIQFEGDEAADVFESMKLSRELADW